MAQLTQTPEELDAIADKLEAEVTRIRGIAAAKRRAAALNDGPPVVRTLIDDEAPTDPESGNGPTPPNKGG